jgi:hypothetical protein
LKRLGDKVNHGFVSFVFAKIKRVGLIVVIAFAAGIAECENTGFGREKLQAPAVGGKQMLGAKGVLGKPDSEKMFV